MRNPTPPGVVVHLIATNFAGGPEKQIVEHCTRVDRSRWRPVVGSFLENRPRVEIVENARARGIDTFVIETRSNFSPGAVGQLRRHLSRTGASILVTHGYKADLIGYLATRSTGVQQVPFIRGYTAEDWRVRRYEAVDRFILSRIARRPSAILLCVSGGIRDMLARHGIDGDRLRVAHNGVDVSRGKRARPLDLRSAFGIPRRSKVLAAAGRLSPEKGHRFLVEAVRDLRGMDPPVHAILMGSGGEEKRLRTQAREAGVADRVHFAGFRRDVLECLAGADLVVNPSLTEGLPNVLLEALSVAAPIVATDVGGVCEIVADGETGRLVPAADAKALARAVQEALDDEPRSREMAERGQTLVARDFSFTRQSEILMNLYDQALVDPEATPRRKESSLSARESQP